MSALEDARALVDHTEEMKAEGLRFPDTPHWHRAMGIMRALIAEHKRLAEDLRITDGIAVALEQKRQEAVAELERLTAELERLGKMLLAVDEVACFICNGPRPDGYSEMLNALDERERLTAPPTDDEHDPRCAKRRHFLGGTACDCKPPTDDEREALARIIRDADRDAPNPWSAGMADAILASDVWRNRRQEPITDAQVEAALRKWCGPTEALWRPDARGDMRAALEAADFRRQGRPITDDEAVSRKIAACPSCGHVLHTLNGGKCWVIVGEANDGPILCECQTDTGQKAAAS